MRDCASERIIEISHFKVGKREDFLELTSGNGVYKQGREAESPIQSEITPTDRIPWSRGSNYRDLNKGPEELAASCRTPRPLFALACRKTVELPFGIQTLYLTGTHLGLVAFNWRSISSCGLHANWASRSKLGLILIQH